MILKKRGTNMISKEQKSNLAKLLATENLNVEHRKVKTAHFVPKTRTLCLPIWDDMSNDLYDLLCGHEVGHALWTPADDKKTKVKGIPHSYLNVIEDIRIDKKMKIKYPGLRKSYFNGYKELVARDFFGKINEDANNMRFIDRLNIFSKSGHLENTINFNDIEKSFIEKSNNLETFDDVIELAKEIFAYSKEENYDKEKDPLYKQFQEKQQQAKEDQEEMEDMQSQSGDSNEDPEGEQQEQKVSGNGEEENKEEENNTSGKSDGDGDENKPENDRKEKSNAKSPKASHNPDYAPEEVNNKTNEALSDKVYEEAIQSLSQMDERTRDNLYVTLPKFSEEKGVITAKRVNEIYKTYYSKTYASSTGRQELQDSVARFKKWKNSQSKTISYMAKEFEMKKAADNYKKTLSSKTGIINMNKIHSYKFNDDIFKRIQVEPGAKNHGMMMFIDWSGSMSYSIDDTIKQTLNLAMFCKAVQIPFRVFAFSDLRRESFFSDDLDEQYYGRYSNYGSKELKPTPFIHKHGDLFVENVQLIEWLSSEQKTPEFNENMIDLYRYGEYYNDYYSNSRYYSEDYFSTISQPGCMRLGGTPLDPSVIATISLVQNFMSKYKIQKMNTIYLTDGCGHSMYNSVTTNDNGELELNYGEDTNTSLIVKDKQTRQSFKYDGSRFNRSTKVMFDLLRAKTGTNIIGFYITSRNQASFYDISNFLPNYDYEMVETIRKQCRKEKVGSIVGNGYDELFIIPRKNLKIQDGEADIKPEMTAAKMKAEFSKTLKTKKISRVLLNKFVERVA